jgi:acetyltransferase-like isoleucine patch superfamily enzyme
LAWLAALPGLSKIRPRVPFAVAELLLGHFPPFTGARAITLALRAAGVRMDSSTLFWGLPKLSGGPDCASRLEIGELCGLNFGVLFELDAPITLESHVAVGHECMFLTRTHDPSRPERRGTRSGAKPIRIGSGSWLGSRCVVLPGVTIGSGSVVGANVVVGEDVPPNTLLVGKRKLSLAKWR